MNINQELKIGDKAIVEHNTTDHDFNIGEVVTIISTTNTFPWDFVCRNDKGDDWYMSKSELSVPIPTLKMIPVEELERLIINRDVWLESFDDHKKGMNALFDKLQEKINKYK